MRFLITAAADPQAPASDQPLDDETFTAYMRFNEEMHRAGVLDDREAADKTALVARMAGHPTTR